MFSAVGPRGIKVRQRASVPTTWEHGKVGHGKRRVWERIVVWILHVLIFNPLKVWGSEEEVKSLISVLKRGSYATIVKA